MFQVYRPLVGLVCLIVCCFVGVIVSADISNNIGEEHAMQVPLGLLMIVMIITMSWSTTYLLYRSYELYHLRCQYKRLAEMINKGDYGTVHGVFDKQPL